MKTLFDVQFVFRKHTMAHMIKPSSQCANWIWSWDLLSKPKSCQSITIEKTPDDAITTAFELKQISSSNDQGHCRRYNEQIVRSINLCYDSEFLSLTTSSWSPRPKNAFRWHYSRLDANYDRQLANSTDLQYDNLARLRLRDRTWTSNNKMYRHF